MNGRSEYDCAVIGAGPGGLTSGIYLRRFQRTAIVFDGGKPRAAWIPLTHNVPGFPRGISGKALLARMRRHASKVGLEICRETAVVSRLADGRFRVSGERTTVHAKRVILATGISDVQPEVENLIDLRNRGLLRYCPVCDAFDYRDREIVLLGNDSASIDKAIFLSRYSVRLHLVLAENVPITDENQADLNRCGIRCVRGDPKSIQVKGFRRRIEVNIADETIVPCDVVYVGLGSEINDSAFRRMEGLQRSPEGFIETDQEQRTSVPGLFAVGDCVNLLSQISVAAGQAAVAATCIHNDLLDEEFAS